MLSVPRSIAIVGIFSLLPTPLAHGHGVIVSTNPAIDAELARFPSKIEISIDGQIQTLSGKAGNSILVKSPNGLQVSESEIEVEENKMSVDLTDSTEIGSFTVTYRYISQDGHPVDGTYAFQISGGVEPSNKPSPKIYSHEEREDEKLLSNQGVAMLLLGMATVSALTYAILKRRKKKE